MLLGSDEAAAAAAAAAATAAADIEADVAELKFIDTFTFIVDVSWVT